MERWPAVGCLMICASTALVFSVLYTIQEVGAETTLTEIRPHNDSSIEVLHFPPWMNIKSAQLPCDLDIYNLPPNKIWQHKYAHPDKPLSPTSPWISSAATRFWKPTFDQFVHYWYVPGHDVDEELLLSEQRKPLKCDNLIITSLPMSWIHSNKFKPGDAMYDMIHHNIGWVRHQKNLCYLNSFFTCQPFPPYPQPDAHDTHLIANDLGKPLLYGPRYWALPLWSQLLRQRQLKQKRPSFIQYIDGDYVFTNRSFTFDKLIDRVERGMKLGHTSESRRYADQTKPFSVGYGPKDDHRPLPSLPDTIASAEDEERISTEETEANLGLKDMAFMIAMDVWCSHPMWLLNSGSMLFQPGKTAEFIFESTIALTNYTDSSLDSYIWDKADQGRVTWILREAFDMDDHRLREMCDELEPLTEACLGDEIVMLRKINMTRIYNSQNVLKYPAYKIFGTEEQALNFERHSSEAKYMGIVCSRWINSGAGEQHYKKWSPRRKKEWVYHCGDYSAHFYGGDKRGFNKHFFRSNSVSSPECAADWPSKDTNFNATEWISKAEKGGGPKKVPFLDTYVEGVLKK